MIKTTSNFPISKKQLKESFGYLSFETVFINMDLIGIRIVRSGEIVCILYRGAWKVGFVYEGGNLSPKQVQRVYDDVPENRNDLAQWEKTMEGKIDIHLPMRDNYVFINDKEVKQIKIKKQ